MLSVRCPTSFIATALGTPALSMLRIAVRLRSWKTIQGTPAHRWLAHCAPPLHLFLTQFRRPLWYEACRKHV